PLIGDYLTIYYIQNSGAAFSLLANNTVLAVLIGVAICIIIYFYVRMFNTGPLAFKLTFGLIIGGAAGNLIDRAVRGGYVVDFIFFRIPQIGYHFAIFNLADASRTSVQQIIVDGGVLVNGRTCKPSYLLRVGDEVCIAQTTAKSTRNAKPCALPLNIFYEDKDLLVVNKAAGMVVHPSPGHVDDTLVNAVLAYYPDLQHVEGLRPGIVHRLDRDTSGLIIVAKNARTQAALIEQMRRHEIVKR